MINLFRLPGVKKATTECRSGIYAKIKAGLLPPPIKMGSRISAWIESEVDAVVAARIAGKSDDEIRQLVKDLVAARKNITSDIAA